MSVLSGPEITRIVHNTRSVRALPPGDGVKLHYDLHGPLIEIEPFDPDLAGPNSYDVHLAPELRVYALRSVVRIDRTYREDPDDSYDHDNTLSSAIRGYGGPWVGGVDVHQPTPTIDLKIPDGGLWLWPGILYLAATVERTLCCGLVPWLDGRSSVGRAGLSVHVTAGRGDDGWPGRWTLEMTAVTHPVKIYAGMRCGQVTYFDLRGERKPYAGKYVNQDGPTETRLHLDPAGS